MAGTSQARVIYLSPLVFGFAHLHHFYESRISNPGLPILTAAAISLLQFSYTYLFGIYATFIFMRTGSLLAVISIHMFCNYMGLPRFWGSVDPYWMHDRDASKPARVGAWTAIYYILLVMGMVSWVRSLYPLTESPNALVG
jgi:prenyl protein peptidase